MEGWWGRKEYKKDSSKRAEGGKRNKEWMAVWAAVKEEREVGSQKDSG